MSQSTHSPIVLGRATAEGTAEYRSRHAAGVHADHFRRQGSLWLSSVGLDGTAPDETDGATGAPGTVIARCLALGMNVIDFAPRASGLRRLPGAGKGMGDALARAEVPREAAFVCARGGVIVDAAFAARSLGSVIEHLRTAYVSPGVVRWDDVVRGRYCIAPTFLRRELGERRAALGLSTIDAFVIDALQAHFTGLCRREAELRLARAFEALEEAVGAGEIASYGVRSSLTLREHRGAFALPDVFAAVLRAAEAVAGARHHLRVLQASAILDGADGAPRLAALDAPTVAFFEEARGRGLFVMVTAADAGGTAVPDAVVAAVDALASVPTDSLRSVQLARSNPGVGTALMAMRKEGHVRDGRFLAGTPCLRAAESRAAFEACAQATLHGPVNGEIAERTKEVCT